MMPLWKPFTCGLLATLFASPLTGATPLRCRGPTNTDITVEQLLSINPTMKSCAPSTYTDECRTASQAVPWVNAAFSKYKIASVGEKAAILSLELFESASFVYNTNHFPAPGRPGQGTRNMMMFPFIYQYAVATPSTQAQAQQIVPNGSDLSGVSDDNQTNVRKLVLGDELSFASGSWFYKTNCKSNEIAPGLQAETVEGWSAYITQCVGTTVTPDRQALWNTTLSALKA